MRPELVLGKTAAGVSELDKRALGLGMAMRRLLIMVDGQRSVADLMHANAASIDVVATLDQLLALGLIAAPAGTRDANMPAEAAQVPGGPRQALMHMAETLLGTGAGAVFNKLQHASDERAALQPAVDACVRLIRLTIDENKAADFKRQAEVILGGH
ncbi:MAG: hypothetical protein M0P72_09805 [Metallibacterium scheffleri]|jgi:hypothetical protein|uniref:hypothetical protein n=1 Tax=Metallibacterium scheffleri TaxID=993689 RepID=UPI0026F31D6A|nr:hypothetical protein [Metallibacterium scheffleri]MCK9367425.1 hypothetical protein [Metallibacterium scheffleri]